MSQALIRGFLIPGTPWEDISISMVKGYASQAHMGHMSACKGARAPCGMSHYSYHVLLAYSTRATSKTIMTSDCRMDIDSFCPWSLYLLHIALVAALLNSHQCLVVMGPPDTSATAWTGTGPGVLLTYRAALLGTNLYTEHTGQASSKVQDGLAHRYSSQVCFGWSLSAGRVKPCQRKRTLSADLRLSSMRGMGMLPCIKLTPWSKSCFARQQPSSAALSALAATNCRILLYGCTGWAAGLSPLRASAWLLECLVLSPCWAIACAPRLCSAGSGDLHQTNSHHGAEIERVYVPDGGSAEQQ